MGKNGQDPVISAKMSLSEGLNCVSATDVAALGGNVQRLSMATESIYLRNRCKAKAKKNA